MLIQSGELLDVRESPNDGKTTYNLVFLGKRWDVGLKREVDSSVQVMVADEHKTQIPRLRQLIGNHIEFQVDARVSKGNKVWFLSTGAGLVES